MHTQDIDILKYIDFSPEGTARRMEEVCTDVFMKISLTTGHESFSAYEVNLELKDADSLPKLEHELNRLGLYNLTQSFDIFEKKEEDKEEGKDEVDDGAYIKNNYIGKHTWVTITRNIPSNYTVSIFSLSEKQINILKELILSFFKKKDNAGCVFILINSYGNLSLRAINNIGCDFEPDNYTDEVIEGYTYIVEDFNRKEPKGRLALLNGPTGTGKTHLVKAMSKDITNATFIMIPASAMGEIANPQLLSILASHPGKKVLVLEDADNALIKREEGDRNLISGLLNISEGIFGQGLDLRILATTNANSLNIDSAITRPGRLSRHITVGALPVDHANKLLKKLKPDAKYTFEKEATLAEVYAKANDAETGFSQKQKKQQMGFNRD